MIGLWAICTIRMFAFHRRTSKNQRKAQRKKWSLKEGSKHEDLALLDEMKKLITRIDSMRGNLAHSANYCTCLRHSSLQCESNYLCASCKYMLSVDMVGSWDPQLGRLVCIIISGGFNIYFELKYRTFYMKD